VAQLYSPGTGFHFVNSYDSHDHNGGSLTRLTRVSYDLVTPDGIKCKLVYKLDNRCRSGVLNLFELRSVSFRISMRLIKVLAEV
jgi:hypothetical protein